MKNSLQKNLLFFVVVLVLSFSGSSFLANSTNSTATTPSSTHSSTLASSVSTTTTYTPHSPISITSDSQFSTNDFTGSGTKSDPYIFENYNITTTSSIGILISSTTKYFTIRNCYFSSNSDAISVQYSSNGVISGNIINQSTTGIGVFNQNNVTISNNHINGTNYGIDVEDSVYSNGFITITNNFVNNSSSDGIYLYNIANATISGNFITHSVDYGIYKDNQSFNTTISNNFISYSQTGGVYIYGDLGAVVFENNELQFNKVGISCSGITASNFQVVDNIISNSSQYGIFFSHVKTSLLLEILLSIIPMMVFFWISIIVILLFPLI